MKDQRERFAKAITLACVRNTFLEKIHEGDGVRSLSGDYTDVKVVTPYGEIAWNDVSRITDDEMKRLMKEVVNNIYTVLAQMDDQEFMATLTSVGDRWTARWDQAELEQDLLKRVKLMHGKPDDEE